MIPRPPHSHRARPRCRVRRRPGMLGLGPRAAQCEEPDSIVWRDDYANALEEARAANRFLWIQFTGPWCPNCTRMERDSFAHSAIVQHTRQSFVPLKLRSDVNEQLALNFNLSGLPATIVVAPNREVVASQQGYLGPAELDAFLAIAWRGARNGGRHPLDPEACRGVQPNPANRCRAQERNGARSIRLLRGQLDLRPQTGSGTNRVHSPPRGTDLSFCQSSDERPLSKRTRARSARQRWCLPSRRAGAWHRATGRPAVGGALRGSAVPFATKEDRQLFLKNPEQYAKAGVAEDGFCVHCLRDTGLLVRGDPRHEVACEGRRYWFPDADHRAAFLESLP